MNYSNHQNEILVNEELVKNFELENPIDHKFNGSRIVGIDIYDKSEQVTISDKELKLLIDLLAE